MQRLSSTTLALALAGALSGTGVAAQGTPAQPAPAADVGFFRPAPDPALTTIPPPRQPPAADEAAQIAATDGTAPPPGADTAQIEAAETRRLEALRWVEEQMDRVEREAEQARAQPPVPSVGAAFTGSTSERDR